MTILFLSRLFYPHVGGVETHVLEIGKRLVKKGHRVIVITEEYQSNGKSDKLTGEAEGIEIRRIDVGQDNYLKKFRILWELLKLRKLIKNADIIHCHDVFFWYIPFRFIFPYKKVFTTFHGYETKFPPSKKAIIIRKISEKLSWGSICVGDYIEKWYGTKSDYVTYGAVNLKSQNSPLRQGFVGQAKLKILFIGRIEEDTGISIYLKVLEVLKKKKISFEFELCGDGALRIKVEKYGKVYGFVNNLDPYINKADIVFASSYLSIFQSMVSKRLVIAAYNNPLKEDYLNMAPFAKWIVIHNSSHKIAEKILWLMEHQEEKEKMINKGHDWAKNNTWEKVLGMYTDLWNVKIPDRQ